MTRRAMSGPTVTVDEASPEKMDRVCFSQLVAGGLAGIVWKFFERVEAVLTDETKLEIAVWLKDSPSEIHRPSFPSNTSARHIPRSFAGSGLRSSQRVGTNGFPSLAACRRRNPSSLSQNRSWSWVGLVAIPNRCSSLPTRAFIGFMMITAALTLP
jgi:hypothetical protein